MAQKTPSDIAIRMNHIKKDFYLPHEKRSKSLKSTVVNVFKKKDRGADTQHALRDISFEVKKGEFFGIIGRNGSGKSTLLKILAEIYQPTAGSVEHYGKLVPFIELGVGFNPELSGRENVYLNGALLGFSRAEIDARYDEIVKFAELEEFMDQKLKNYSSGMQVRLAFSVATRAQADILVLDEVLAVGDAEFQRKCYDYFKGLKKNKKVTVILVTHNMSAVKEYCDRALLIQSGLVSHIGQSDGVSDEYLKMFNRDDGSTEVNYNDRFGNQNLTMEKITVKTDANKISIHSSIASKSKNRIEDIKVSYRFYDKSGKLVAGFGTQAMKKYSKLSVDANETVDMDFEIDNVLNNAKYTLATSITSYNNSIIYDNWKTAATITNTRDDAAGVDYPIVLSAEGE